MSRHNPSLGLDLSDIRRRFFAAGELPAQSLRSEIAQSWRRCLSSGLNAESQPDWSACPLGELSHARDQHLLLRQHARPELEALHEQARSTGCIVILTDPEGLILDAVGHTEFLDRAARVALRPGVRWQEVSTGTNAIGTAIHERRAIEVRGAEHYFDRHRILSCAATPLLDPFGQLAGVLDLSGDARTHHLHALGLVQMAARQIEHRAFAERFPDDVVIRLHRDPALLGTPAEAILVFRDGRLHAANRQAQQAFGFEWSNLGRTRFDELFAEPVARVHQRGELHDWSGERFIATLDGGRERKARTVVSQALEAQRTKSSAAVRDSEIRLPEQHRQLLRAARLLDAGLGVMIRGETGTGKEVFARALHRHCARHDAAWVAVNCAALPEALIEAELFGYTEGAFTGARRQGNPGLLRQADGGVLFLDEIGDMPLSLQARLLRVLQERAVQPLGGGKPVPVDFVLICATHRDLEDAVERGEFRADLFYRINQHEVHLPRVADYPDRHALVAQLWSGLGYSADDLPADLHTSLAAYHWPGNLRQLVSVLRGLAVLCAHGEVPNLDDLPRYCRSPAQPAHADHGAAVRSSSIRGSTEQLINDTLARHHGNMSAAARALGVSRSTLYRRLQSAD
ncbi:MAG: sigma-54-dependent Fis family transcriptional regulator [Xanthomonadales bacterium]|jgi:transcriptional regulator of acetoin/glycerol metabolism|nr:sigma-54-dependent Fis family transcriptional regulator [Xanthomonadales bacterium]